MTRRDRITVQIPAWLVEDLQAVAGYYNTTPSALVTKAVKLHIERLNKKRSKEIRKEEKQAQKDALEAKKHWQATLHSIPTRESYCVRCGKPLPDDSKRCPDDNQANNKYLQALYRYTDFNPFSNGGV